MKYQIWMWSLDIGASYIGFSRHFVGFYSHFSEKSYDILRCLFIITSNLQIQAIYWITGLRCKSSSTVKVGLKYWIPRKAFRLINLIWWWQTHFFLRKKTDTMKHVNDINTCLFNVNDYKNWLKHLNIITFTYCPELKRDEKELRNGYWFFKEEKHIKDFDP